MPNWCYNEIEIRGPVEIQEEFKKRNMGRPAVYSGESEDPNRSDEFTFNALVPVPEEVLKIGFDGHSQDTDIIDGYTWQIENWGTKWDIDDDTFDMTSYENMTTILSFSTAWSPPLEWLRIVSSIFPELMFQIEFTEEGCYFGGIQRYQNGILIYEYDYTEEELLEIFESE